MKLEHVAINVPDPIALAQWLVDHLGMRIVVSNTSGTLMHFVADEAGSMLEIYNNPAAPMPDYAKMDAFNLHFAFSSADMAADRDRLVAAGATTLTEITTTPTGDQLLFLRTPWHIPFQLVKRKKPLL